MPLGILDILDILDFNLQTEKRGEKDQTSKMKRRWTQMGQIHN